MVESVTIWCSMVWLDRSLFGSLFSPMSLIPRRPSSASRFFRKTLFILVWMAGRPIFLGFHRTPYKRCFYLLLSKNNQVINDWTKPRNNPLRAKLQKIDLPYGWIDKCLDFCNYFLTEIAEYQKLITRNPIFLERVEGVGIIGGAEAINWGLSGPMLRASGIQWDRSITGPRTFVLLRICYFGTNFFGS